jgi:hypothetical protein
VADPAASELELVLLARGLIVASPEVTAMLYRGCALPPAISHPCARLIGDALAQVWPALWRRGGTQPGTSLDAGGPRRGRIWERHAPVGLTFSVATLTLLRWLLGTPLTAPLSTIPPLAAAPLTIGDQVIAYLALDAAAGTPAQAAIAAQPLVRAAPLAWLGFARQLATSPGSGAWPAFGALCVGAGAIVIEALTGELARRWREVELGKRAMTSPAELLALGAAQDATLSGFLAACDQHRRRDLAGFVIDAAAPLIAADIPPAPARLDPTATLAYRAEARVAAGALLRGVMTWAAWDQAHRGVRFIDDDYAAAQVLLARFEAIQAAGAGRAAAWLADLASLAPTTLPPSAATVDAT